MKISWTHVVVYVVAYLATAAVAIDMILARNRLAQENKVLASYLEATVTLLEADAACERAIDTAQKLHDEQLRLRKGGKPRVR